MLEEQTIGLIKYKGGISMPHENGTLSIHSENIFPIIKKWLYSDKDIFIRELISNACDAIVKLKKLDAMGETQIPENITWQVNVVVDDKNKTIKITDNGIGMTAEEIKKYINQIAFSGAEDFLEKYKDKANQDQIIGHFGLGFYSAFMVAHKVEIDTLSYQEGAEGAHWTCQGGTDYEITSSTRKEPGTTITLHISDDGEEFLNEYTLRSTIQKYCSFMPIDIYLDNPNQELPKDEDGKEKEKEEPKPLNNTHPLWLKSPNECTDDEYKDFYHQVFMDFKEPLFWIHLNMDYPLNLKGILYFPKIGNEFDTMEGKIKLYSNQVFVAENIKEVIPEFLLLLKGTIDCPDLPLNVSRSFLQNDGYVQKISSYITKKVADKLTSLYKKEKESFTKFWDDIHPFIKFGCLKDEKFYDKVQDIILYKTTSGDFVTLSEYLDRNKEKHENKVYYVTNEQQQAQYIKMFKAHDLEAVILPSSIDQPFISHIEMKNKDVKFARVDADLTETMKNEEIKEDEKEQKDLQEKVEKIFKKVLDNEKLNVKVENLKSDEISSMVLLSEESRRMQDMAKMYGMMGMGMPVEGEETLVLNKSNPLVQYVIENGENTEKEDTIKLICNQLYDLAMLSHKPLSSNAMTEFISRSNEILKKMI